MKVTQFSATTPSTEDKAGWTVKEYLPLIAFGATKFYTMAPELRPREIRLGTKIIIIEPPREYLDRLAKMQAAEAA